MARSQSHQRQICFVLKKFKNKVIGGMEFCFCTLVVSQPKVEVRRIVALFVFSVLLLLDLMLST